MVWVCLRLDTLQTTVWPSFFLLQSSISPLLPVFANNTKLCKTDEILTICCSICTQPLPHIRCLDLEVHWQNRLQVFSQSTGCPVKLFPLCNLLFCRLLFIQIAKVGTFLKNSENLLHDRHKNFENRFRNS